MGVKYSHNVSNFCTQERRSKVLSSSLAAMSEQLKYIVDELNKDPFKRNYNLIRYTFHFFSWYWEFQGEYITCELIQFWNLLPVIINYKCDIFILNKSYMRTKWRMIPAVVNAFLQFSYMIYFIYICHTHLFYGNVWTHNWLAPNISGFIA